MNCPVCERSLAPTLSICPTCGAMMNDTVREELQTKITSGNLPQINLKAEAATPRAQIQARPPMTPPPVKRPVTTGLAAPKTSPTLVEFQNRNAPLPDWRLQIQNAVQQRKSGAPAVAANVAVSFPSNGSSALNAEPAPVAITEKRRDVTDPLVAKAMNRIAESKKTFSEADTQPKKRTPARPFGVVSPNGFTSAAVSPARVNPPVKPKLVATPVLEKRDTNKLPPIDDVAEEQGSFNVDPQSSEASVVQPGVDAAPSGSLAPEIKRIQLRLDKPETDKSTEDSYDDEIEDLAPFSMRFGAGLFDLIIGGFATMLILSPLAFTNGNWFSSAGLLTFAGAFAGVSFLYMTVCVGFFGKTMGMRLFSLELVDALENEYPTLRQAAVSTAVFLLSLGFLGTGFITAFFNEERRALHDLLSGTILVREF
jgi:uncharacterized RDD family membrane protein YckC